ncbi:MULTISPECIES: ZirU family protein [unclassified Escherichia]|uniref:ZirU family protein n=1 Tax=unclassified Escherichia TaxID=2608889 RepID=UPI001028847D|nr:MULTISPECIES: ZirU family protein [unclassified Escherichia]RZM92081.1 hypothetical protein D9740_21795 [Escherichia sp. E14V5]RZN00783.1 hypothetical protein D9741_20250 [Escherichia sp. E14V7]RZN18233.1 hypothetical protein D9734_18570 [Escherichia sp. E14S1]RZN23623.1 hypothetical protein D9739_22135 [Escherichia sp. E14V10]
MKLSLKKKTAASITMGFLLSMSVNAVAAIITSSATMSITGHEPTLTAGEITFEDKNANGILDHGDVVKIDPAHDFAFADVDGDKPDTTTPRLYSWKIGSTEVAVTETYTIQDKDLGQTITLFVTPQTDKNITEPFQGKPVQATVNGTAGGLPISGSDDVIKVVISGGTGVSGAPIVNDTLTATPTCTKACGVLNYQWQVEDSVNSGKYIDITGATNSTWKVTEETQKRKVQVVVSNP